MIRCVSRPKLAVIGLEGAPAQLLASECGDHAELLFFTVDRASRGLPPGVAAMFFSRFVQHKAFHAAAGRPRFYVRGGVTALKKAIREFAARVAD
jgi:hypothetical protein